MNSLVAGHDDSIYDIIDSGAAREVVDGSGESLQHGANGTGSGDTLHEFIGYIACFERGEDEGIGMTGNLATGCFHFADVRHDGSIRLEFTIDLEVGSHLASQLSGAYHLIDAFVSSATLGGERAHGDAGLEAGDIASGLSSRDSDLSQLLGSGIRHNGAIGEDEHVGVAVGAILGEEHNKCTAHHRDARFGLEHLESSAEHMRSGAESAGHHGIGIAILDHKAAEVEGIFHLLASLLDGDALLLAKLAEEFGVGLCVSGILAVDERSLLDQGKAKFEGATEHLLLIANKDDIGHSELDDTISSLQSARL